MNGWIIVELNSAQCVNSVTALEMLNSTSLVISFSSRKVTVRLKAIAHVSLYLQYSAGIKHWI
jgi:hypothetical protein